MPTAAAKKLALVTGASRGIGAAIVSVLESQGYDVIAVSRGQSSALFKNQSFDLSREEDVDKLQLFVKSLNRPLGVLINNAAVAKAQGNLGDAADKETWRQIFTVNLDAAYLLTVGLASIFEAGKTRIINIGSTLSLQGVPDQPAYTAAKHALLGLTRSLALRFAAQDITVNMICPGWTNTAMARQRSQELGLSLETLASEIPLGRMIEPEEIAGLVSYLLSASAKNITGQALVIDGGLSL